jgi:hypothetical protein
MHGQVLRDRGDAAANMNEKRKQTENALETRHLPTELMRLRDPRRRRRRHATDAAMFKAKSDETATNSERREAAQRSLKRSGLGA